MRYLTWARIRKKLLSSRLLIFCTVDKSEFDMDLEKFSRQLDLMILLTQNRTLSVEEVGKRLNMSSRTVYRYIEAFKEMGFVVKKSGTKYRIDHTSPFFKKITSGFCFTEDEALTIGYVLNSVCDHSIQVRHLRQKLAQIYDNGVLARHVANHHLAENISMLFQAIREERVAVLRNYRSPSSGKVGDRIVEPYMFMNENSEVRCYEVSTGVNKTFKVTRAEKVELLDLFWAHRSEHTPFYTDLFGFSGEEQTKVSLLLDPLATQVLLEEYPGAADSLTHIDDEHQRLDTDVCSYIGVGRFVIGLFENIDIVAPADFQEYVRQRLQAFYQKLQEK